MPYVSESTWQDMLLKQVEQDDALEAAEAEKKRLREALIGMVHEAKWMVEIVPSNNDARVGVRERIIRAERTLKETDDGQG